MVAADRRRRRNMAGLAVATAAVLLLLRPAASEMLHVEPPPCAVSVPREACFASAASHTAAWTGPGVVRLPLNATVQYVQSLLQVALEVEHSTIPLYLTTMYSIVDQASFAATTMRSVVMEEMLHMVNAANVLNAIGGAPFLDHPKFIPKCVAPRSGACAARLLACVAGLQREDSCSLAASSCCCDCGAGSARRLPPSRLLHTHLTVVHRSLPWQLSRCATGIR